jgi:hypothetical protein
VSSTIPNDVGAARLRRARWWRRLGLALLGAILLLGVANVLGVRTATVTASGEGYRLTVTYAAMTRPGLGTPWSVEVTRPGGLEAPVTLATTAEYYELFDLNGIYPEPAETAFRDGMIVWSFDPVEGDTLRVHLDVRLGPSVQVGKEVETALVVDGRTVASVRYATRVMP